MEALSSDSILATDKTSRLSSLQCKKISLFCIFKMIFFVATDTDVSRSPPGAYDQTWPPANREDFSSSDKPPFLPPHLLNIILNKDTAAHVK